MEKNKMEQDRIDYLKSMELSAKIREQNGFLYKEYTTREMCFALGIELSSVFAVYLVTMEFKKQILLTEEKANEAIDSFFKLMARMTKSAYKEGKDLDKKND